MGTAMNMPCLKYCFVEINRILCWSFEVLVGQTWKCRCRFWLDQVWKSVLVICPAFILPMCRVAIPCTVPTVSVHMFIYTLNDCMVLGIHAVKSFVCLVFSLSYYFIVFKGLMKYHIKMYFYIKNKRGIVFKSLFCFLYCFQVWSDATVHVFFAYV